jgi:hypothetical protein
MVFSKEAEVFQCGKIKDRPIITPQTSTQLSGNSNPPDANRYECSTAMCVLEEAVLQSKGICSGFYCPSVSTPAILYVSYGLPHMFLILGLSPYTLYSQEALNIVNCQ